MGLGTTFINASAEERDLRDSYMGENKATNRCVPPGVQDCVYATFKPKNKVEPGFVDS